MAQIWGGGVSRFYKSDKDGSSVAWESQELDTHVSKCGSMTRDTTQADAQGLFILLMIQADSTNGWLSIMESNTAD